MQIYFCFILWPGFGWINRRLQTKQLKGTLTMGLEYDFKSINPYKNILRYDCCFKKKIQKKKMPIKYLQMCNWVNNHYLRRICFKFNVS